MTRRNMWRHGPLVRTMRLQAQASRAQGRRWWFTQYPACPLGAEPDHLRSDQPIFDAFVWPRSEPSRDGTCNGKPPGPLVR